MKIIAINSSPRTGSGSKTELMLEQLATGMRDAGATVDIINLREKSINNCIGCFTCWSKTPGQCVHNDDMARDLFPRWLAADLAVYATPLYYHTMNAAMSTFRERTLPAVQPFFDLDNDGKTFHPLRHKVPDAVWLSVCGLPEPSEFDLLSAYLNRSHHQDITLVAEIYRASADTLTNPFFKKAAEDILDATRQAGRELVESMRIDPDTMARISRPLVEARAFADMGNLFWKTCIDEGMTPKQFFEANMVPRPDSLEPFMSIFPMGLNTRAAGDRTISLQFCFTGQVTDTCYFKIGMGRIEACQGVMIDPDLTIETPFDLWMDIMTRRVDGQQMFMEQRYTVAGDIGLMVALFNRQDE